jgi:hypothetical protein
MKSALTRELARWWAEINENQFEGAMRPPSLLVDDTSRRLGCWESNSRTLHLARRLLDEQAWGEVIEVLRHEMAHQYVDEVLGIRDETAHGPAFRRVCAERAIDSRAAGHLKPNPAAASIMRKIQGLLALAESDNENEAKAAMSMAHQLMRKHNIRVLDSDEPDRFSFVQLGTVRRRTPAHEKILAGMLGQHFFVQPIWVQAYMPDIDSRGRVLEVCGRPENLAIAEYVHGFLLDTCERLWRQHKRLQGISGNRDRRRFLQGVLMGFHERLSSDAGKAEETGLVWVGDAHLNGWVGQRYPHLRSGRRTTVQMDGAWAAGRAAGQRVVLRRAVSRSGKGIRGLLGIS